MSELDETHLNGKPFRQVLLESEFEDYKQQVQHLINQDYVNKTNSGFAIDVLKLVDSLSMSEKEKLTKYMVIKFFQN